MTRNAEIFRRKECLHLHRQLRSPETESTLLLGGVVLFLSFRSERGLSFKAKVGGAYSI